MNDIAKCPGRILTEICDRRDTCHRFTLPEGPRQLWVWPILLNWMCSDYLPHPGAKDIDFDAPVPSVPDGCVFNTFLSRCCGRGTKSCEVTHED